MLGIIMKRTLIFSTIAILATLSIIFQAGCSDKTSTAATGNIKTVGVSALKSAPESYLGHIEITGRANNVFPEDGVIEIGDEKACCSIYLLVPFTPEQQAKLDVADLYEGALPARGIEISAFGELQNTDKGYRFVVSQVKKGNEVLVALK